MCKDVIVFIKEALIAQSDQINILQMVKKLEFPDIQLEEHPKEQVGIDVLPINDSIVVLHINYLANGSITSKDAFLTMTLTLRAILIVLCIMSMLTARKMKQSEAILPAN